MEDRRWLVLTIICLDLALVLPVMFVHGYAKLKIEKRMSASDLIVALADASNPRILWLAYIACQIAACMNGFGAHAADLDKEFHYTEALRFWYLTTLLHVLSAALNRTTVGLASISRTAFPTQRRLVSINIIISSGASILFFFLLLFQCQPIPAYWSRDRAVARASCYTRDLTGAWYAFLGVSMAADAVLASFAVASTMGRRKGEQQGGTGWAQRVVAVVFNMFAFGHVIATAVQLTHVAALARDFDAGDLTWSATPFALLSLVGPSTALLVTHAAKTAPYAFQLHQHHQQLSRSAGAAAANRDSLVRDILRERKEEQRQRRMKEKKGEEGDGDGAAGRRPFRLVVLNGREEGAEEEEALAAVVEGGLARLVEREGGGRGDAG